jgi:hypothetical protein
MLSFIALVLAGPPQQAASTPNASRTWTGCVQAGNAPSTYRLNLDSPSVREGDPANKAVENSNTPDVPKGTAGSGTQGAPFVQLISGTTTLDLTGFVGKRVRIHGRELSEQEAAQEAARHPNRQEANETAAGTGGTPQRHDRYVRVEKIAATAGECR